uniref:B box-type domain-containing protein n=1 Tax=Neobodo designis TaxID=312471 RepID=A0A6U4X272_NEODS
MPPKKPKRSKGKAKAADGGGGFFSEEALAARMAAPLEDEALRRHERCPRHPGEYVLIFCQTCRQAVCSVCAGLDHDRHERRTLADITAEMSRESRAQLLRCQRAVATLKDLGERVGPSGAQVHDYIDAEVDGLIAVINAQREHLHGDVDARAAKMGGEIDDEIARCEEELRRLDDGRLVLEAMASGEGVVDAPAGQLIAGALAYDDFWEMVDCDLHAPERMRHALRLQLPVQDLQEVCEGLAWTQQSLDDARAVFPPE